MFTFRARGNKGGTMKRWMLHVMIGILGLAIAMPAAAQTWNWKKHAGKTIRYVATNFQPTKAIEKQIPQFEQETGISPRAIRPWISSRRWSPSTPCSSWPQAGITLWRSS
jgi:hypothetical protein